MTMLTQPLTRLVLEAAPLVNGDNVLVAAKAGQVIRVYRFFATAGGAVNLKWWSNPAATNHPLTGTFILTAAGSSILFPPAAGQAPWLETLAGESLNLGANAAVNMGGFIDYIQL